MAAQYASAGVDKGVRVGGVDRGAAASSQAIGTGRGVGGAAGDHGELAAGDIFGAAADGGGHGVAAVAGDHTGGRLAG